MHCTIEKSGSGVRSAGYFSISLLSTEEYCVGLGNLEKLGQKKIIYLLAICYEILFRNTDFERFRDKITV